MTAVACGGGSDETSPTPTPTETPTEADQTSIAGTCTNDLTEGPVFTLVMQFTAFHPNCFIARSEQSIHIVNKDDFLHNFTITGTQVDVDVQPHKFFNGESAGLAPGTYSFFCSFHQSRGMTGTLIVQ